MKVTGHLSSHNKRYGRTFLVLPIRVADEDVEHEAAKRLMQGRARVLEAQPDNFGEVLILGIAPHHFIEAE